MTDLGVRFLTIAAADSRMLRFPAVNSLTASASSTSRAPSNGTLARHFGTSNVCPAYFRTAPRGRERGDMGAACGDEMGSRWLITRWGLLQKSRKSDCAASPAPCR